MKTAVGYKLLVIGFVLLTSGCTKVHEVTLENLSSAWQQEFHSSSLPFSGSQIKVEVTGSINGKASISVFPSAKSEKSLKTMSVGPGDFSFTFDELEYWNKTCMLKYLPEKGAVGSFNVKVTYDGD